MRLRATCSLLAATAATSLVLAGSIFVWIFSANGPWSALMTPLGLGGSWLGSTVLVIPAIVVVGVSREQSQRTLLRLDLTLGGVGLAALLLAALAGGDECRADGGHGLAVLERRRLLPRAGGLGRRRQEGGLVVRGDVADRAEHGAAQAEHGEPDHGERRGQAQPQPPRGTPRRGGGAEGGQVGRGGHAPERRGWFDDQTTMGAG